MANGGDVWRRAQAWVQAVLMREKHLALTHGLLWWVQTEWTLSGSLVILSVCVCDCLTGYIKPKEGLSHTHKHAHRPIHIQYINTHTYTNTQTGLHTSSILQ